MSRSIKEMTYEELCYIANIATGGYFNSELARDHKEVEVGGYGWRRRVEWKQTINEYRGIHEYHYFEIIGENKGDGWQWHCKTTNKDIGEGIYHPFGGTFKGRPNTPDWMRGHIVNTLNPHKIVDYCREQGLDIENTLR